MQTKRRGYILAQGINGCLGLGLLVLMAMSLCHAVMACMPYCSWCESEWVSWSAELPACCLPAACCLNVDSKTFLVSPFCFRWHPQTHHRKWIICFVCWHPFGGYFRFLSLFWPCSFTKTNTIQPTICFMFMPGFCCQCVCFNQYTPGWFKIFLGILTYVKVFSFIYMFFFNIFMLFLDLVAICPILCIFEGFWCCVFLIFLWSLTPGDSSSNI